jgi:hypothetical protein
VHHTAGVARRVVDQAQPAKVHLHLAARLAIHHAHGCLLAAETELADGETVQRAIRDHHTAPAQQHVHLRQRQPLLQPRSELLALPGQRLPRRAHRARSFRAHKAHHRAEQFISQLTWPLVAAQPARLPRPHVTADRLPVHPSQPGHLPQRAAVQPQPQDLFHFDHRYLPVRHAAKTAAARPEASEPRRVVPSLANQRSHYWQTGGPMPLANRGSNGHMITASDTSNRSIAPRESLDGTSVSGARAGRTAHEGKPAFCGWKSARTAREGRCGRLRFALRPVSGPRQWTISPVAADARSGPCLVLSQRR